MDLSDKIRSLYPDITVTDFASGVITLQDDGDGPYIAAWNHPTHPQPTEAELAAVTEPPPPPVPQSISDRQFFQMAAVAQIITQAEALAAVQVGTIPAVLQTIVDGIPDPDEKFAATMILSGATQFERTHPLTEAVGGYLGWTSEQIDQFFVSAAGL